jgi:hypothetical protein
MAVIRLKTGEDCFVDDEDFALVSQYAWCRQIARGTEIVYAQSHNAPCHQMHRLIMGARPGQLVDHIDRDGLNNRRSNLRFATKSQNAMNSKRKAQSSTGYKGVIFHRRDGVYTAQIRIDGRRKWLGSFHDPERAYAVYCEAAKKHHGEFARLA